MTELTLSPVRSLALAEGPCSRALSVRLRAPGAHTGKPRDPVHIAFAIDTSGSMAGAKLALVKTAVARALEQLRPDDAFAIVTFDDEARVLTPVRSATPEGCRAARGQLAALVATGTTHLSGGWLSAAEQLLLPEAEVTLSTGALKRTLLLTDGEANRGLVSADELFLHAARLRARGVSTSTFGVGESFNEGLLGPLADVAGGNFYFIAHPEGIPALIGSELGEAVDVVARHVRLTVRLPQGATARVLAPYPHAITDAGLELQLPDLVSHQELDLPLVLELPGVAQGASSTVTVSLAVGGHDVAVAHSAWAHAAPAACAAQPVDYDAALIVAERMASMARAAAAVLNREEAYDAAKSVLRSAILEVRALLGEQAAGVTLAARLVAQLTGDLERCGERMSELARKELYFTSGSELRSKLSGGTSRRSR
jgi:Ca-activated chloride channel family protein